MSSRRGELWATLRELRPGGEGEIGREINSHGDRWIPLHQREPDAAAGDGCRRDDTIFAKGTNASLKPTATNAPRQFCTYHTRQQQ